MIVKFHYRENNNIVFRIIKVEALENNLLQPYILINNEKYMRKDILGELDIDYEDG